MVGASGKIVWAGRVISGLISLLFAMSALMKFRGGAEVIQGMAHLGLPESLICRSRFSRSRASSSICFQ
jgi:hypothetical protein